MSIHLSEKHALAGKRIIVAGAGIAGMTFARALYHNWPSDSPQPQIVLYERSSRIQDRSRAGYTMGIRGESGLAALSSIGLLDKAIELSTTTSNGSRSQMPTIWTKDWRPMIAVPAQPVDKDTGIPKIIRLVRHVLRDILLEGLPSQTHIQFDTGCEWARRLSDGRVRVGLSNGSEDECDLLVAADGANSKIRTALLPDQKLEFAGAVFYGGTSHFPSGKPELLRDQWGINISGQGIPFLNFPIDASSGAWALSFRSEKPIQRIRGEDALKRQDELIRDVKERGKMFEEPFRQFVDATDPATLSLSNAMHKYPIDHSRSLPDANVIFIGDANHPMSPFSGNGANMALADGVELAKQLATRGLSVRRAIDFFDSESIPRSKSSIDRSWWVIRILHSRGVVFVALRAFLAVVGFFLAGKKR